MDFTELTVDFLKGLSNITGSYGMAIIVLTVLVRVVMWPLSVSQQKSMKKMQELSPKLKEIQNRHKGNPQEMQKKMAEFYKEHQFNPFGGCFPLLIQMPIFILLYAALSSPQFNEMAGKSSFWFIHRLDAPIRSHAGVLGDKAFGVEKNDTFAMGKNITVFVKDGKTLNNVLVNKANSALEKQTKEIVPGQNIDFKVSLDKIDLPFTTLAEVTGAKILVINNTTKEIEYIDFAKKDNLLVSSVKTENVKPVLNIDVLILIALFGVTMFLSQKVMTASQDKSSMDPAQRAMQEQMGTVMPIMVTAMFVFFPIPAGVLLYMVVSNIIQVVQTVIINKQIEIEEQNKSIPAKAVLDVKPVEKKDIESDDDTPEKMKRTKKNKWK